MQTLIKNGQSLSRMEMRYIVAGNSDPVGEVEEEDGSVGGGCYYCLTQCTLATTSAHTGTTGCTSGPFQRCRLSGLRCNGGEA